MTTRRQFIGGSSALIASSMVPGDATLAAASEKLDILFLGGTGFIGPHQIEYALARGHNVSMFNRGRRSGMYGGKVEQLVGNRDAKVDDGLSVLEGDRTWDVVVDNSGYVPRHVADSAGLLKDRCGRYIYTSTVAVYDFEKANSVDINSPLLPAPAPATEMVTGQTYGPLKAECDRVAIDILGERLTIVRPTYIVGPGDTTDRFTYWVERFHRGGDIVCPSGPKQDAQWIDVRDLCHWLVSLGENDTPGIFNAVAPEMPVTREEVMHGIKATTTAGSRLHWPSAEILQEFEYPTPMFPSRDFSRRIDSSNAQKAGLSSRPLADTVRDTHEWWQSQPAERRANPRRWPTPEQEAAVLERLKS
ncbi:MAG: NAD-dependent epimerase/dehydratase family protein [Woeseiaceae bacterium]|nr:NAD-dependent epimerase/dehydratase family protein [Woeseiaceae bacterium]